MDHLALLVGFAVALLVLFWRAAWFHPVLIAANGAPSPATPAPGEEEEQLPETDRAPVRWLPWSVAAVAAVRVVVLLTVGA